MSESGGRRIKRAINIDMSSIHFVDTKELETLSTIYILENYLRPKQKEVEDYNVRHEIETNLAINGRNQTNIGIFRAYVQEYLHRNPNIHPNMTFLVRQLAPTETGLPLEIYVFSKDQVWANYEAIQADIFDHLLAALPTFGCAFFKTQRVTIFNNPWDTMIEIYITIAILVITFGLLIFTKLPSAAIFIGALTLPLPSSLLPWKIL